MNLPCQISICFLEVLEDLHSCGTLGHFFERFCYWGQQLCATQGIGIALVAKEREPNPHRVLFYTGGIPMDPQILSKLPPGKVTGQDASPLFIEDARGKTLLCCFELSPEIACVLKASRVGGKAFKNEEIENFCVLQRLSTSVLQHSPLMISLRFFCQRLRQNGPEIITNRLDLTVFRLTRRECEVLKWVEAGKQDGEIAVILNLNCRTVQTHVRALLHKLECENRLQLMTLRLSGVMEYGDAGAYI